MTNQEQWFIRDRNRDMQYIRGPYKSRETAAAIRSELENNATEKQNES